MKAGLIVYAIYILAVLIWCASRMTKLRYVKISSDLLNRWAISCQSLIVIDLRTKTMRQSHHEAAPGALNVSMIELPSLLRWIPPLTAVVFCCEGEIHGFDAEIEALLFRAEINAVYLLVFPMCAPVPKVPLTSGGELGSKSTLFPIEQTRRRCLYEDAPPLVET
jgi:hypothetical protein